MITDPLISKLLWDLAVYSGCMVIYGGLMSCLAEFLIRRYM